MLRLIVSICLICTGSLSQAANPKDYPDFSWDTVPVAFHFGKSRATMTAEEAEFVASRSSLICLEKGHAGEQLQYTEDGIEQEARQLKEINPNMKVIFYWNTFLDYPMFRAHEEYEKHPEWWLRTLDGKLDKKNDSLKRYDLSNPDVRDWWTDVAQKAVVSGSCDGVFMDAFPQIAADANREKWGHEKYDAIQQGLVDTIKKTRAKIGADKLIFYNGIRSTPRGQIGSEFTADADAAMIEHFGHFQSGSKESMLSDIEAMSKAGKQGKIVVFKAWPDFSWIDKAAMKKPLDEKRKLAAENITFPLAAFLVGAQKHSYFIYNWGYRMELGCLDWYPEFDKPLGEPLGDMTRKDWTLCREFKHASVTVNLETKQADITWRRVAEKKPNVIFMLTDDLGYSDIGCYGAQKVKTHHIDRLAAEGVRFTDFHTAASICSPSRAAFLTGAYPQRSGLYMGINPNRTAHWFLGLNPDEITIAEQFKKQGYATYMVGKWHLGTEPEFLPRKQGFDHYYGMPCNYGHSPKFFDNDQEVFVKTPLDQLTKLYTQRIISTIHNQAKSGEPFFLYYAHNYPHTPYQASTAFKGTSQDGVRGDVMQELDWSVGEMMAALDQAGIAENTIVIFTSDNGPTANAYAGPYRGTKYVTFEGGHRVPFIFHWPARIKEPAVSNVSINAMDVFPTLSAAIGASLPDEHVYDGENLLPLFEGEPLKRPSAEPFYYYNCENLQAVRRGEWKMHLPRSKEQLPFWDKNKAFSNLQNPVLYNLRIDQSETTNVADDNPEVVRQMSELAASVRQSLGEFMQRGKSQRPTGSLFPDVPVISHEKDWESVGSAAVEKIARERQKRHPKPNSKNAKPQRKTRK